jgi:hypothetical protein
MFGVELGPVLRALAGPMLCILADFTKGLGQPDLQPADQQLACARCGEAVKEFKRP